MAPSKIRRGGCCSWLVGGRGARADSAVEVGLRRLLRWLAGDAEEFGHSFSAEASDLVCVVSSSILGG